MNDQVGERRNAILQKRQQIFQDQQSGQDVWKAIPAVVNPDADVSVEEMVEEMVEEIKDRELSFATESCVQIEPTVWDPDSAFSELDNILDALNPHPQSTGEFF